MSVNQSVSMLTGSSLVSRSRIASSDSSIISRWRLVSMPIMNASDGSAPGTDAEHDPAAREVVEQHHAVGEDQRVVVRQRTHAGAELDVAGALGRDGHEHLGAGDDLVAGGVVLADPRLVVAELVEALNQFQVALQRQRRVLPDGMERGEEDAELQGPIHRGLLTALDQTVKFPLREAWAASRRGPRPSAPRGRARSVASGTTAVVARSR